MSRRRQIIVRQSAEERARILAELRAAPSGIQSVDVDDDGDALALLFAGRSDTSAIDAGDLANERAAWRQS
jgi:hypothetical protein